MTLVIKIHGVKDLLEAFGELPRTVRGRNMKIALNAGGGIIRDAAVANMPQESGLLKKAMKVKVSAPELSFNPQHWGNPAYAVIGASSKVVSRVANVKGRIKTITTKQAIRRSFGAGGFITRRPSRYLHLIEKGTKPHGIKVSSGKRALSNGESIFGRAVKHPGTAPQRPLGRAVQSSGAAAQAKIIDKLKGGISEWAARRAARVRSTVGV